MRYLFISFLIISIPVTSISQTPIDTVIILNNGSADTSIIYYDGGWGSSVKLHDDLIGNPSLPFRFEDSQGVVHDLESYEGKILILYFWSIWSWDSCENQTFALNEIVEKYGNDIAVLSFVTESMGIDEHGFLQKHTVKFPIIPNTMDFGMSYHGHRTGIPIVFIVDEKGIVRKACFMPDEFEQSLSLFLKN